MPEIDIGVPLEDISTDFPVSKAGTFDATITKAVIGRSEKDKLKVTFSLTPNAPVPCVQADKEVMISGRELWWHHVPLEKGEGLNGAFALGTIKKYQKACALPVTGAKVNTDLFLGKSIKIKVSVKERNGAKQNNIDDVMVA
jgi:hypothetical protein